MAKTIEFDYEEQHYTLEFTKRTVREMEQSGFKASDITDFPMTVLPRLFAGAFKAHHRYIKQAKIDEIYDLLKDKEELIGKLAELYNEPIMALLDNGEGSQGNLEWTANF